MRGPKPGAPRRSTGRETRGKLPGHETDPAAHGAPLAAERPARRFLSTTVEVEGREETKVVEIPTLEPAPWDESARLRVVGTPVRRADALEKVTGKARYTADVQLPGMLYAALLRAPIAKGRVTTLDPEPALAIRGVRGVLLMDDVRGIRHDGVQILDRNVHYAGQAVAAICAESQELAERALGAVRVEYESAPHAVTAEDALTPGAPAVRSSGNRSRNSPRVFSRGDVEAGLRAADVTITREYRTPVALHTALEPHGAVASWEGDRLTVWESTQGIFGVRSDLAEAFTLPLNRVRVVTDYMGGGFGAKNGAQKSTYIAAALARKLGRPVRCVLDREGEQVDSGNRSATIQRVTLGATRDGRLAAIAVEATIPLGVGGWQAGAAKIYHELYACPNVRSAETFVFTNAGAMTSFRAPGHVEGAFGLECAMDALARELGIDPLELRRRNYAEHDQEKGRRYSDKRLDECYRLGADRFGWNYERRAATSGPDDNSSSQLAVRSHGRRRRGQGMASLVWSAGGGPPAYATVRLNADGTVDVLTGSQDLGTGSRTVLAQIAAEALGARISDVRTVLGDTERLPYTGNSWGSMTTASVGPAVRVAALEARGRLLEAAAALLADPDGEPDPEQLEARDSVITVCGTDRTISFADVGGKLGDVMIIGQGSRGPNPEQTAICAFGAQFAEVEVDTETGVVRVLRIVSAHDSGRIVNPMLAASQIEGGVLQGVGYALFEERVMDRALGVQLNATMHDYKIPTMADAPSIDVMFVDGADVTANHTGAKGLAEPPIIPTAPAIANAVADALGVEPTEIPLTPWRILDLLKAQR
ncbi:MAG: xanthine dehydrogenase family protein molybdopterin-binding subunit [Gemmatimonadaceae bacterium]